MKINHLHSLKEGVPNKIKVAGDDIYRYLTGQIIIKVLIVSMHFKLEEQIVIPFNLKRLVAHKIDYIMQQVVED